jgi:hypothetical protein
MQVSVSAAQGEPEVPSSVEVDEPWRPIEAFSELVRESRTEDESREYGVQTPSMASSPPTEGVTAPLVCGRSGHADDPGDLLDARAGAGDLRRSCRFIRSTSGRRSIRSDAP